MVDEESNSSTRRPLDVSKSSNNSLRLSANSFWAVPLSSSVFLATARNIREAMLFFFQCDHLRFLFLLSGNHQKAGCSYQCPIAY